MPLVHPARPDRIYQYRLSMFNPNANVVEEIKGEVHRVVSNVLVDFFDNMIKSISIEGPPPSQPGESPHQDSGDLLRGFHLEDDEPALMWQITSEEVYAIYLEFGTVQMFPRPFLWKSIHATKAKFDSLAANKSTGQLPKEGKDVKL